MAVLAGALLAPGAWALPDKDLSVTEELLEIMRQQGDISPKKYEELKERYEDEQKKRWKIKWSNGTKIESPEGDFKLKFGGRIMNDWYVQRVDGSAKDAPGPGGGVGANNGDGTRFRRARIFTQATLYDTVVFKSQFDFAGGDVDFKDVYLGLTGLPGDSDLLVGHQKEAFSLEELTSSKYITFMERSVLNAFAPSRNTGMALYGTCGEDCFTWAIGGFRETEDDGDGFNNDGTYNLTTRLTAVPWSNEDDDQLIHIGGSYSHQFRDSDDELRYRARPGISQGARFVDTGDFGADDVDLLGAELAFVCGSLHAQGEYAYSFVQADGGRDLHYHAAYGQVGYFLTGETRPYKRSRGTFGRVKPKNNFSPADGHWGAFEVAARVDHIDLHDGYDAILGGELMTYTGGLNWYLFPNVRVMTNYVWGRNDDGNKSNVAEMRFQIDF